MNAGFLWSRGQLLRFLPVVVLVYMFLTIFVLRAEVGYFYIASLMLVVITALALYKTASKPVLNLARWLIVLGAIGVCTSTILTIEKIELLTNPQTVSSCSISPVVACSPIIKSKQASAFGLPNPLIGIFGFASVLTAGMTILAGATKLQKAWWRTLMGGITFGAAFCAWLFYQGVFVIGSLCLYCFATWLITFALFWLVLRHVITNSYLSFGKLNTILIDLPKALSLTYLVIFMGLFYRWSDYWLSLL